MKVGDLVKVKHIEANMLKHRGKIGIVISIEKNAFNQPGFVCRFHTGSEQLRYHEGRLEVIK